MWGRVIWTDGARNGRGYAGEGVGPSPPAALAINSHAFSPSCSVIDEAFTYLTARCSVSGHWGKGKSFPRSSQASARLRERLRRAAPSPRRGPTCPRSLGGGTGSEPRREKELERNPAAMPSATRVTAVLAADADDVVRADVRIRELEPCATAIASWRWSPPKLGRLFARLKRNASPRAESPRDVNRSRAGGRERHGPANTREAA